MTDKQPMQPIYTDEHGTVRFKMNAIVRDLLDHSSQHGFDLNTIACREYTREDRVQLAQLIGYSIGGFSDLSYVRDEEFEAASLLAEGGAVKDERDAIIQYQRELLAYLRESLQGPAARLFEIHPDDLKVDQ